MEVRRREFRRRSVAFVVTLTTAALALAGCAAGSAGETKTEPVTGGDLVFARAAEPTTLTPSLPSDNISIWTIEEIFDTLVVPSVDGKSLEPALATEWVQSDDGLSWTFSLRDDVVFSDGTPMTSEDVAFSIDQNREEDAVGNALIPVLKSIETPDPHTVVFNTATPSAPLPAALAIYSNSVVPKDYGGKSIEEFGEAPIGTGPFAVESWTRGSDLKLVRNERYWDEDKPKLDSVTFTVAPDGNTRATQLAGGQVQINEFPPFSTVDALANQAGVSVEAFPSTEISYLGFNTLRPPFDDVDVRQAIAQAIDKDAIISAVLFGNGDAASTFLSPAFFAHSDADGPSYDVAAARATLAGSSVPEGFETTITVAAGNQDAGTIAQLIQASLAEINISVTIQTLDPAASREARAAGNYDMALGRFTSDTIDPDDIARYAGTDTQGTMLYTGYSSERLNELVDLASTDPDETTRKGYYDEMQDIILDEVPYLPLYYPLSVYSFSDRVQDFHPAVTGNYFLKNVWIHEG